MPLPSVRPAGGGAAYISHHRVKNEQMKYGVRYVAGGSGVFPLLVGESVAHDAGMYEAGSGWVRSSPVGGLFVARGGGWLEPPAPSRGQLLGVHFFAVILVIL